MINFWLSTSTSVRRKTSPFMVLVWTLLLKTLLRLSTLTSMWSLFLMMLMRSNWERLSLWKTPISFQSNLPNSLRRLMIRRSNHINLPIFSMIQSKVLKRLFRPMINQLYLVLNLFWWNSGYPRKRRSKRERRRKINKLTNLLATFWILPELTLILLKVNNQVKVIWCKEVLKAKVWCLTNTIKEDQDKEVATAVAEVAKEEVTEVVINNNMLKDLPNNQELSNNNNITLNFNNSQCPNSNLEWPHVDSTNL